MDNHITIGLAEIICAIEFPIQWLTESTIFQW